MKLLLDTHIWLWSIGEPHRLSRRIARELDSSENEIWLSSVSLWEAFLLHRKGRLHVTNDFSSWARRVLGLIPIMEAPLSFEVALAMPSIILPHSDPADFFLAATAKAFGLTLITADRNLLRASGFDVLPNA
jgi:PIN domain nuclease of toxin-antitoxin system